MDSKEINSFFDVLDIKSNVDEEHYDPYEFGKKLSENNHEIRNISYSDRIDKNSHNEQLQAVYG